MPLDAYDKLSIGPWTAEEDQTLIDVHRVVGPAWIDVARELPGRYDSFTRTAGNKLRVWARAYVII